MSDQEMHFADPDWESPSRQASYAPRQASPDAPRTARRRAAPRDEHEGANDAYEAPYSSYEEGYRIHEQDDEEAVSRDQQPGEGSWRSQQYVNQKRPGRQKSKKRSAWFWVLLVVIICVIASLPFDFEDGFALFIPIVLAVGLIIAFIARTRLSLSATITETHTFDVSMQPKIAIRNDFGAIRVHSGGEDQQVVIQTTKSSFGPLGNPARASIFYEQNKEKNRINVKAKTGWHLLAKHQIDFDITLPRQSDLDIRTDAGTIVISGVNGVMNCHSDAGSVKVMDAMLRGDSRLKTDAGTVRFDGSLDPHGSYTMTTDAGSVSVTLPAHASFKLDAKTDVGSINSDFPVTIQHDFPGAKTRGEVGFPPYPTLKLRTDVGSINIRER